MSLSDFLVKTLSEQQKLAARRFLYTTPLPLPVRMRITGALSRAHGNFAIVAPDLSYLYVQVPKAASSTMKRYLWKLEGLEVEDHATMRVHRERGAHLRLPDLTAAQVRRVTRGEGTFRFTFVRNPYARLISAYRNKVLDPTNLHPGGYSHRLNLANGVKPDFEAFVRAVAETSDESCDIHWMSQHRCGLFDIVDFDHVGRVETFNADLDHILERIAGPSAVGLRLERLNSTSRPEGPARRWFTKELADLAYDRYRVDFDRFGYDRESYVGA